MQINSDFFTVGRDGRISQGTYLKKIDKFLNFVPKKLEAIITKQEQTEQFYNHLRTMKFCQLPLMHTCYAFLSPDYKQTVEKKIYKAMQTALLDTQKAFQALSEIDANTIAFLLCSNEYLTLVDKCLEKDIHGLQKKMEAETSRQSRSRRTSLRPFSEDDTESDESLDVITLPGSSVPQVNDINRLTNQKTEVQKDLQKIEHALAVVDNFLYSRDENFFPNLVEIIDLLKNYVIDQKGVFGLRNLFRSQHTIPLETVEKFKKEMEFLYGLLGATEKAETACFRSAFLSLKNAKNISEYVCSALPEFVQSRLFTESQNEYEIHFDKIKKTLNQLKCDIKNRHSKIAALISSANTIRSAITGGSIKWDRFKEQTGQIDAFKESLRLLEKNKKESFKKAREIILENGRSLISINNDVKNLNDVYKSFYEKIYRLEVAVKEEDKATLPQIEGLENNIKESIAIFKDMMELDIYVVPYLVKNREMAREEGLFYLHLYSKLLKILNPSAQAISNCNQERDKLMQLDNTWLNALYKKIPSTPYLVLGGLSALTTVAIYNAKAINAYFSAHSSGF